MSLTVCGPQRLEEGCLEPCEDVHLCVQVERAQSDDGLTDEFVYTFTVQNCSRSTLRSGDIIVRLGRFTCLPISVGTAQATGSFETANGVGQEYSNCQNGSFNSSWTGDSNASINADEVRLFSGLKILPGSWQGWFRFTSDKSNADLVRLPSQVVFRSQVFDLDCTAPCTVEKCVEADGDVLKLNVAPIIV